MIMGKNEFHNYLSKTPHNKLGNDSKFAPFKRNKGKGGIVLSASNIKTMLNDELEFYRNLVAEMLLLQKEFEALKPQLRVKNSITLSIGKSPFKRHSVKSDLGLNVIRYFVRWEFSLDGWASRRAYSRNLIESIDNFDEMAKQIVIQGHETFAEFEINRNELNRKVKQSIDTMSNYLDYLEVLEFIALKKQTE